MSPYNLYTASSTYIENLIPNQILDHFANSSDLTPSFARVSAKVIFAHIQSSTPGLDFNPLNWSRSLREE